MPDKMIFRLFYADEKKNSARSTKTKTKMPIYSYDFPNFLSNYFWI